MRPWIQTDETQSSNNSQTILKNFSKNPEIILNIISKNLEFITEEEFEMGYSFPQQNSYFI